MIIAGVMSGSSLDGLDVAIIEFKSTTSWHLLWTQEKAYSKNWVQRLKDYQQLSAMEYIKFKAEYSTYVGQLLKELLDDFDEEIDYISFHGHTLLHIPEKNVTEQIGNGGLIAGITGIKTLTDFRNQDVSKGGVGTPLAPLVEINLFKGHEYYLNLGGIANITKIKDLEAPKAYDVCPCNQVLNHFSNKLGFAYDRNGQIARMGSMNNELLTYLNTVPYFTRPAPKSLDNIWIVEDFIPKFPSAAAKDILNTYCNWMANCIADEIENPDSSLMVSGGGAHNSYFIECLEKALLKRNCNLVIPDKTIINYKEAILMSLLALKYLKGEHNVLSSVTGASSDSIGGALYKV